MGFRVVALGRGADIERDVLALGAHLYMDTSAHDAVARLRELGGAQAIVTTVTDGAAVSALIPALAPQGQLMVLGAGKEALTIQPGGFVSGERTVQGSFTGSPLESEKTMSFSVLTDVRPMIETMPLEQAQEAYRRVVSGAVKFRMVLTMSGHRSHSSASTPH
jgi:alcohol dehydrogenase